jgi:hypothetical protein
VVLFAGPPFYEFFTKKDMGITFYLLGTRDSPSCNSVKPVLASRHPHLVTESVPDTHDQGARFVGRSHALFTIRRYSTMGGHGHR